MTKDWTGNSVSYITTSGFANNKVDERAAHDYYATEPKAAQLLLELDEFDNIWECACGGGDLARVFEEKGKLSLASDKYDQGYSYNCDTQIDFLSYGGGGLETLSQILRTSSLGSSLRKLYHF